MEITERVFFFFKQKTAYEMRISDWSSDVCSSDLGNGQEEPDGGFDGDDDGAEHEQQHDQRQADHDGDVERKHVSQTIGAVDREGRESRDADVDSVVVGEGRCHVTDLGVEIGGLLGGGTGLGYDGSHSGGAVLVEAAPGD